MADYAHGGDSLDHGMGFRFADTCHLLCPDRGHCRRVYRRGTGYRPPYHRIGGGRRGIGHDGRRHHTDAGRCDTLGGDMATAGLSFALAATQYDRVDSSKDGTKYEYTDLRVLAIDCIVSGEGRAQAQGL